MVAAPHGWRGCAFKMRAAILWHTKRHLFTCTRTHQHIHGAQVVGEPLPQQQPHGHDAISHLQPITNQGVKSKIARSTKRVCQPFIDLNWKQTTEHTCASPSPPPTGTHPQAHIQMCTHKCFPKHPEQITPTPPRIYKHSPPSPTPPPPPTHTYPHLH